MQSLKAKQCKWNAENVGSFNSTNFSDSFSDISELATHILTYIFLHYIVWEIPLYSLKVQVAERIMSVNILTDKVLIKYLNIE